MLITPGMVACRVAVLSLAICQGIAFAVPAHANVASPARGDAQPFDTTAAVHDERSATDTAFVSADESTRLEAVQVIGWPRKQSYMMALTSTATGTDTPTIDVPQSIQVIPSSVLRDQAAQSLADAVRNAPGIFIQQGEGNRDEFFIRGVKTKSDFFVDGLRDDSLYYRDLYNVAHVDVLQGPAAILFGRGGAGGIINLVTRQPERESVRNFSVETGSWEHLRGTLDVGGAIGASGAFRVMAMGEDSSGFRDHFYLHRHAVNPKFSFQLSESTQLDFDFSYLDDRRLEDRGIPSRNGRPVDVPRDLFFGSVDQNLARARVEAFNARLSHVFNDNVAVSNTFRVTGNNRLYDMVYPGGPVDDQDNVKLAAYARATNRLSYLDRAELVATFDTGTVSHRLIAGSELGWQRDDDLQTLPVKGSKDLPGLFPLSDPTSSPVALPFIDFDNHVVAKEFGAFVEDQISLGTQWKALIGVRWDRFSVDAHYLKPGVTPNFTDHVDVRWSPRIGLIYKPVENDSIYASVTQTYTPQGANLAVSLKKPKGADLSPEEDTNFEIGNKLDLFDGKLSFTAAVFDLYLKHVVSEAADGSGKLVNTGEQRNRGIALSSEGAITSQLSVYANYTRLNSEITKTTKDAVAGARVGLVPRNSFSVWTRYILTPNWGVGAGVHGESAKYTSYDNFVVLPGYAVVDAMAYYQNDTYRLQLNLNNLTDRTYYATASGDNEIMPGTPRSVSLGLSVNF